ncbi:MAG: DUF1700 domain-containing protein [Clostridiaceae bacterium]|nr:DUF1700 domain-containing protein [Clostridiaceae bacterium]
MNKQQFLSALRQALSGLPDAERDNVMQYYEDYFLDAEGESEEEIIRGLGNPQKIADDILREYRELQPHANPQGAQTPPRRWKGINPWLLAVLVVLAIPIGIPLAGGLLAAAAGILLAGITAIGAVLTALIAVPTALIFAGAALSVFSLFLWFAPPSAVMTLGVGLFLLSLGVLLALLVVKLCRLFLPPVFRGIVAILRWPIDKLRGALR